MMATFINYGAHLRGLQMIPYRRGRSPASRKYWSRPGGASPTQGRLCARYDWTM
jgi:hypothetical protein